MKGKRTKLINRLCRGSDHFGFCGDSRYYCLGIRITRKDFWNSDYFVLSVTDKERGKTAYFMPFIKAYDVALALKLILDGANKRYCIKTRYNGLVVQRQG